jgi:hypothetical protein
MSNLIRITTPSSNISVLLTFFSPKISMPRFHCGERGGHEEVGMGGGPRRNRNDIMIFLNGGKHD